MSESPEHRASNQDYLEATKTWLNRFEKCVRMKQYATVRDLFHPNVVYFGLETNIVSSLDQLVDKEFKVLWPSQVSFTIDHGKCAIIPGDPISVAAAWYAASRIAGAPMKHGRITLSLALFEGRTGLKALHCHMSLNVSPMIVS